MDSFASDSAFFGVALTLGCYWIGAALKKRFRLAIFNPLLIAVALCIAFLLVFRIDYQSYNSGAKYLSYLLTPATVCLALPLYRQLEKLRKNLRAILCSLIAGALTSMGSVLLLSMLFGLSHQEYVTFLPKSITTAIGMGVSEELGGIVPLTVAAIIITGIFGNAAGDLVMKLFKITEPIAKGLAMGSASHAIGTARAMEWGELEGAMSSLSIVISGIITVAAASFFAMLY